MRHLSFRILAICILYPPLLYIFGVQYAESHLTGYYQKQVEQIVVGDVQPLFNGAADIEAVVPRNIQRFIKHQTLTRWGLDLKITVSSRGGRMLYPPPYKDFDPKISQTDSIERAAANYEILTQGLSVSVEAELPHNRLLTNAFLTLLILSSLVVLYVHVRSGAEKAEKDEQERSEELQRLEQLKNDSKRRLQKLESEHHALSSKFAAAREDLNKEREKTNRNEDEFIQEIEDLEQKLNENISFQEEQLALIEELKAQIDAFEKEQERVLRLQKKGADEIEKRFQTLYKRLSFHRRAFEGFVDLPEELKLKAEETVLALNENPDQIAVKRKVFTKKRGESVLEVVFGYRGRLYFRRLKDGKIEVLVIGTKNSQGKNLEFIDRL